MCSRRYMAERHHGPRHLHHRSGGSRRGRGGPRARRGDVRAAALALLGEQPMHGYEMIKEIEERSGGYWRPSAGSIYPTLQLLEEQGLIAGEETEGKRLFALTDDGRTAIEEREKTGEPEPWEQVRSGAPAESVQLGNSFKQLAAATSPGIPRRRRGPTGADPRAARRDAPRHLRDPRRGGVAPVRRR